MKVPPVLPGFLVLLLLLLPLARDGGAAASGKRQNAPAKAPLGVIDEALAAVSYAGGETFVYDVSWTGGIKIGEIHMALRTSEECRDCFEIESNITTSGGIIHALYPVRDRHLTLVRGARRLPYFCEIWQREGRSYSAHKRITYDQEKKRIIKEKDGDEPRIYELGGSVHNEFSSFFSSRVMPLVIGQPIMVPTFGDDQRREVVVRTLEKTVLEGTIFGDVPVLQVSPILEFSGLYDKRGDTVIWYTDDECRVPVQIRSRIVIGSLTATLVDYTTAYCARYATMAASSDAGQ